jgi:small subunit ribosomal protein S9
MASLKKKKSQPMKVHKVKKPEQQAASKGDYTAAVGRRKSAVARIRLMTGRAAPVVNEKAISDYFSSVDPAGERLKRVTDAAQDSARYTFTAKIDGSGMQSQFDAMIHGLARAFVKVNEENRKIMRGLGLLTRDARMKESRKMGQGGKARKKKQSPKR